MLLLDRVPMFYTFFLSTRRHNKHERRWAMMLMLQGLRSDEDFLLLWRRQVFHLLAGYMSAPMPGHVRHMIRQLFVEATRLPVSTTRLYRSVFNGRQSG